MLQAELRILGGKFQGKAIPLNIKRFLVGREQDCHLRPNSESVSRHHCVFIVDDYGVRVRDLGSTNGTKVNNQTIRTETSLSDGDAIEIGKLQLQIAIRVVEAVPAPVAEVSPPEFAVPANQSAAETMFELPAMPAFPAEAAPTALNLMSDTTIVGGSPAPAAPPQFPAGMPQYAAQPMGMPMMPPGYPPQGYAPMGYPGMPGYPGYGAAPGYAPMGYPQPMAGYPAGYGYPQAPAAPAAPAVAEPLDDRAAAAAAAEAIPMKLPPPESTGVKAPAPAPSPAAGAAASAEEKPSNSAADIIKQYMQRRTTR